MKHLFWLVFAFSLIRQHAAISQPLNPGAPVSSLEYKFIRAMTDSIIVLVKQEYNLKSKNDEYVYGDLEYFGKGYSIGVITENRLWVEQESLSPWVRDSLYKPFANRDTLVPILKKTFIRPLYDSVFTQVTVTAIDSFPDGVAALSLSKYPHKIPSRVIAGSYEGWAVIVHPEQPLVRNEKTPIKVTIINNKTEVGAQKEILLSAGTAGIKAFGGAFFTSHVQTGRLSLAFAGLLRPKAIRFQVCPIPDEKNIMVGRGGAGAVIPPPDDVTKALKPLDEKSPEQQEKDTKKGSKKKEKTKKSRENNEPEKPKEQ